MLERRPGGAPRRFAAVLALALLAAPAGAQRYGRWWWDGAVGLGQRQRQTRLDGERSSRFEEREVRLAAALNGFIVDPAVGDFRLALDAHLSDFEGSLVPSSDRLGVDANVNVFPGGHYPSRVYFRHQLYDYGSPEAGGLFNPLGLPDASTEWGGRLRLRRGPLRGTLVGFEHTTVDFLDPAADEEVQDQQFVDWSGSGKRLQHHVRLERSMHSYGTVDLEIEDTIAKVDQQGELVPGWQWDLVGLAFRRDVTTAGLERGSDDLRLRTRVIHELRDRDRLDLRYSLGLTQPDAVAARSIHAVSAFYYRHLTENLELVPFAVYSIQSAGALDLRSPQAGLRLSWRRSGGLLETHLSARASYGRVEGEEGGMSRDESVTSLGLGATIGHDGAKLRQELEVELGRDELRLLREPSLDAPDFQLPRSGLGSEDFARTRLTLTRRWDSRSLSLWGEWNRRESSGRLAIDDFEAETLRANAQLAIRDFNLQAETGETSGRERQLGDQDLRFTSASVFWRPRSPLSLRGLYRVETRELALLAAVESEQAEAGFVFRLGRLMFEGTAFERTQRVEGRGESEDMGFRWSITRRFAGWLPIVTGTQRRGVIR